MTLSKRQQGLLQDFLGSKGILDRPDISLDPTATRVPKVGNISMPNTGPQDFSNYLLTHTSGDRKVAKMFGTSLAGRAGAESEKAGVISRLFDTLSIPLNTLVGIETGIKEGMDKDDSFLENVGDSVGGFVKSVAGGAGRLAMDTFAKPMSWDIMPDFIEDKYDEAKEKYTEMTPNRTHEDLLHEQFGVDNKVGRYGGGFALDLALDPLNMIGAGFLKNGAKSGQAILDAKAAISNPSHNSGSIFGAVQAEKGGLRRSGTLPDYIVNTPKQVNPKTGNPLKYSRGSVSPSVAPKIDLLGSLGNDTLKHNMIPNPIGNRGQVQVPRTQVGTPLMDEARDAIKFQRRGRVSKGEQARMVDRAIRRDQELASKIEAGQIEIPNPARTVQEKMARAQNDWERAMIKSGQVVDKSGRFSVRAANQVAKNMIDGTTPKNVVQATPATGAANAVARDIADDIIDTAMGQRFNPKTNRWHKPGGGMTRRNLPLDITPAQQVAVFNKVLQQAPKEFGEAKAMLASAENHMISLGVQPVWHNGMRVKLSDVMETVGDHLPPSQLINEFMKKDMKNMDPVVRAAIQGLSAQRSVNMSEVLSNVTQLSAKAVDDIARNFSGPAAVAKEKEIVDTAVDQAVQMGFTQKETAALKDLVKDVVDVNKLPTDKWISHSQAALMDAVSTGKVVPKVLDDFNKAVERAAGTSYKDLAKRVSGNKAVDTVMLHTATWYGRGEMRRFSQDVFTWGQRNAESRAQLARRIAMNHTPEENFAAFRMAAGMEANADPKVVALSNLYSDWMTRLFRTANDGLGKTNAGLVDLSVAQKSMTMMDDVNRHLKNAKNAFQFTNKSFTDTLGNTHHFNVEATDWMKSWVRWEPKDPVAFMYDLDLALEKATKEYALLDDFVGRYGSLTKSAENNFQIKGQDRIKDFWVPEQIGKEMTRVMGDLQKADWSPTSGLGRFYSKALRIWKTGVTIYLPSHHVRNAIGDVYLMWLAGHSDPRDFITARRIMHSQRTRYREALKSGSFDKLDEFTDPQAMKWAETRESDVLIHVGDTKLTASQLYISAHQRGLLLDANQSEDIFGKAPLGEISVANTGMKKAITQPLGGKVHGFATEAAEYREHFIRLAHYNAAIKKNLKAGKSLKTALDDAAHEVRKWHPDGRDLTQTEQKMRMLVPFYSWIRKSTPLLIQSLVTQPAKVMAYPKGMQSLQGMLGIEGTNMLDPYPDDQLFPEWIRSYGIGPIGDPESDNAVSQWFGNLGKNMINLKGDPYGYTIVNPSNPTIDMFAQFGGMGLKDTMQGVLDASTPFAKVPFELATNRDFTGAPISKDEGGRGVLTYLGKQIPFTAPIQRITDMGEKERAGREKQKLDWEALMNQLTAMGVRGTGPYIKSAEFEALDRAKAAKEKKYG